MNGEMVLYHALSYMSYKNMINNVGHVYFPIIL